MNEIHNVDISLEKLLKNEVAFCFMVSQIPVICKAISPHDVWTCILCAFICMGIFLLCPRSPGGGSTSFNFF